MDTFITILLNSFKMWEYTDQFGKVQQPEVGGALFMWTILLIGIIGIAIIIERWYYIVIRSSINADKFMERIRQHILSNNIKEAVSVAEQSKEKALPYIVLKGLKRAEVAKDFRDIQNAVDEATLEVLPKLANRMGYLTMLSSIATLMGLAGTIYGLILAFSAVGGDMPAAQKAQFLANGISAAMGTTILGLGVAIPIIVIQTIIQTKMGGITDEIDEHAVKLINLLTGYKPVS